ncbi:MAG TPA: glycosyltransferase family 2 protein [Chitinophagales bacterium]|nr:glycosyltransferase family 2 protein [Chitinophagales bacterium]
MTFFSAIDVSLVVPFFNEGGNIEHLVSRIYTALKNIHFELILVDDGSTDNALENLQQSLKENSKIIKLNRNYGQSTAIKAGFDACRGNIIALLDGDLQNNPEDLIDMLTLLQSSGADMIQGYRRSRKDNANKRLPSLVANKLIKLVFNLHCNDVGCSIKVFNRKILPEMIYFNGFHRYIPLIAHINNFTILEKEVSHSPRNAGISKYGIGRIFPVLYHLLMLRFNASFLNTNLNYSKEAKTSEVSLC